MSRPVPRSLLGLLLVLALAGAGCAAMPESGPVVATGEGAGAVTDTGGAAAISARSPQEGQSPAEVVRGFLDAMQAWPTELTTAKEYLSADARSAWNPRGTIVYEDSLPPQGSSSRVQVRLGGAARLDDRGAWQGRLSSYESILQFTLVTEDGQFKITNPPSAVVVPETWFEQRFTRASLYFLDPTGSVLVPEPVFVGNDEKFASTLVGALLAGPGRDERSVVTSAVPPGLKVDLSVPVTDGTAAIALAGDAGALSRVDTERMLAQLEWTLRQDPDVAAFTLAIDGRPVRGADGTARFGVDEGLRFDPTGYEASSLLYGLRDGVLVAGSAGNLDAVDGPFGTARLGVRSVAVDLGGRDVAGVSADGRSVLLGAVRAEGDADAGADTSGESSQTTGGADSPSVDTVVSGATDLLPPAWDHAQRLWLVDRTEQGAVITWRTDERDGLLQVPGISGTQVKRFLVSRDGSRLVAVVRTPDHDEVRVSRIRITEDGRVAGATRARKVALDSGQGTRVRDLCWSSPTSVAVLNQLTTATAKVTTIGVDGSPGGLAGEPGRGGAINITTTLSGATSLVGSPVPGEGVYAVTDTGLADLTATVRGPRLLDDGVSYLTFAG